MAFAAEMLDKCKKNLSDSQQTEQLEQNNYSVTEQEEQTAEVDVNVFKWPHEAILLLIEEYRKKVDNFCSGRISQKKIWQSIGDELLKKSYNVTGPQCQSKFGGLKRTYKSIKDHNSKSGNGTRTWPYFNLLDDLLGAKPYITPIGTVSSTGKRDQPEMGNSPSSTLSPGHENPKKKPNYSSPVDKVVLAIEENRKMVEENRERMHKEKMDQKKEAINLLARLVSILETKSQ